MYGTDLVSVCAIGEEMLFTLTPEPEIRKRMHWEPWQKPYYLRREDSDAYKEEIQTYLVTLDKILEEELSAMQASRIEIARKLINDALAIDCLNADQCHVSEAIAMHMKSVGLVWVE